jgi:hypothetical protein
VVAGVSGRLRDALRDALAALALTYTSAVEDGQRPHWCRFDPPRAANGHEAMCAGMLMVEDNARAVLDGMSLPADIPVRRDS